MGLELLVYYLEPMVYCSHKLGDVGLKFGNVDGVLSGYLFYPIEGHIHLLWSSVSHNGPISKCSYILVNPIGSRLQKSPSNKGAVLNCTLIDSLPNTPRGIRIPVASVKGRCPRPLDDGGRMT
jgi:hypothetical protein